MLKHARDNARHNVAKLIDYARRGVPIVGVEPSCITCFRDEYPDLVQTDASRQVAELSFFFEEFIAELVR
jgi:Fe-S oxidoreductase